jgi:hypothetical protein
MAIIRTYSTCEKEETSGGICVHATQTMATDDLSNDNKMYVVYDCSLARPARCQVYMSDRVLDFSISKTEELDRVLEERLEKMKSLQK